MSVVTREREPKARHGARFERVALALTFTLSLSSCGQERVPRVMTPAPPASPSATAESIEAARRLSLELEMLKNLRFVGMDDGPVPDFQLRAGGTEYRSDELVGQRAFVVVFFATWCEACGYKLESMQRALTRTGPVSIIPVSVDGPETWPEVGRYLEQYGISAPAVRATDYPFFAFSYNPFETVPLLVIVGRNGGLADYQLGFDSEQESRLQDSLRLAKTIGPLANPRL